MGLGLLQSTFDQDLSTTPSNPPISLCPLDIVEVYADQGGNSARQPTSLPTPLSAVADMNAPQAGQGRVVCIFTTELAEAGRRKRVFGSGDGFDGVVYACLSVLVR